MVSGGRSRAGRGFTLVELLVVIAVIAVIMAILLNSLKGAKDAARAVECRSNLRQFGLACDLYRVDHRGLLPLAPVWTGFPLPDSSYQETVDVFARYMDFAPPRADPATGEYPRVKGLNCPADDEEPRYAPIGYAYTAGFHIFSVIDPETPLTKQRSVTLEYERFPDQSVLWEEVGARHRRGSPNPNTAAGNRWRHAVYADLHTDYLGGHPPWLAPDGVPTSIASETELGAAG